MKRSTSKALAHLLILLTCASTGSMTAHSAGSGHAHGAHVHGEAQLDLVVDGRGFEAQLIIPMESLVGFERPPRSPDETQALERALSALKTAEKLLRPSTAAQCRGRLLELTRPDWSSASAGHADVQGTYRFECAQPDKLTGLEVMLFEEFRRLRRVDMRLVDASGTRAQRLGRNTRTVKLAR